MSPGSRRLQATQKYLDLPGAVRAPDRLPMKAPWLLLALALAACTSGDASTPADAGDLQPCTVLFGAPNDNTGLGADQCGPSCRCGGLDFTPPTYSAAFIQSLLDDWILATPYPPLTVSPYQSPAPAADPPATVCAILPQGDAGATPRPYTLATYASQAAAQAASAKVTHFGHCGVCSTLANLAVYMKNDDLTAPVRNCALDPMTEVACLQQLGFDLPCAQAWAYDADNDRSVCEAICAPVLYQPYNTPDGSLNPCIQCDEDLSGPVFKGVAGRTRRNSGIPNAICRPCSEVQPLVHAY